MDSVIVKVVMCHRVLIARQSQIALPANFKTKKKLTQRNILLYCGQGEPKL